MDKLGVLSGSPLFEMLSNQELEYVADLSRPRRYSAGQVIFEEGELGDSLFVIASGEVDLAAVGRALIADAEWVVKLREGRLGDFASYSRDQLGRLA